MKVVVLISSMQLIIQIQKHEESFHSINKESQYLQAIEQVASIILDYDSDKNTPMYGFGGIIYENAIKNIKLKSPSCFNPIIRQAMRWTEQDKTKMEVNILFYSFLQMGKYMDEDQAFMSIVDAARLPLSLIVLDIGDLADLQAMDKLDGNYGLEDILGRQVERDQVKYVNFNKVRNDQGKLAQELLDKLPKQLVQSKVM